MKKGGVERYANLEVRYVTGHNPDLVLTDAGGRETKRIDLTKFKTQDQLHELMRKHRFLLKSECEAWRDRGECLANTDFMRSHCSDACRNLVDKDAQCALWAQRGECKSNSVYMFAECPVSCGWKQEL